MPTVAGSAPLQTPTGAMGVGDASGAPVGPSAPPAPQAPVPEPPRTLGDMEIDAIRRAVAECGGNISEASKRLGISRNTIYRKLRWKP